MNACVMPAPAPWANTKQARGCAGFVSSADTAPALPTSILNSASFMASRSLGEGIHDGLGIMSHQLDVGRRLAVGIGQAVGIECASNRRTRFRGDLTDQPGVADVLQKHRRDLLGLDLGDEAGDVAGA